MKSKVFVFIIILKLAFLYSLFARAESGLTASGKPGGMKVFSAEPSPKNSFSLGYQREYFRSKNIQFQGKNDLHASQAFIRTVPFSFMQLFLTQKTILNHSEKFLSQLHSVNLSKTELGTLLSIPLAKNYFIGIEPQYVLFNGNGVGFFQASSSAIRLLTTYIYEAQDQILRLHLNSQFFWDRSRKIVEGFNFSYFNQNQLYGVSNHYSINHGIGLELDYGTFTPFVEYTLDQILKDDPLSFFKNPNRLTSGLKILPYKNASWRMNVGGEYGFSHKERYDSVSLTPKVNLFAGLTFTDQPKQNSNIIESKNEEPKTTVKVEVVEEPKPLYPIYTVSPKDSAVLALPKEKEPVKKGAAKKKPKKKKVIIEISDEENEEVEEQRPRETSRKETAPTKIEKTETLRGEPPVINIPDTTPPATNPDSYKNYSDEAPNKDFLIQFR